MSELEPGSGKEEEEKEEEEEEVGVADLEKRLEVWQGKVAVWSLSELTQAVKTPRIKRTKAGLSAAVVVAQAIQPCKLQELKKWCRAVSAKRTGTKAELVARIADHYHLAAGIPQAKSLTPREQEVGKMKREELEHELSCYDISWKKGNVADMRRKILHAERYKMVKRPRPVDVQVRHHVTELYDTSIPGSILHIPHDIISRFIIPHLDNGGESTLADGRSLAMSCRHLHGHGLALIDRVAIAHFGVGADRHMVQSLFETEVDSMNQAEAMAYFRLRPQDLDGVPHSTGQHFVGERIDYNGRSRDLYGTVYKYKIEPLFRACLKRFGTWQAYVENEKRINIQRKRRKR